ncbi:hypothetical protein JQX13_13910 [Archangium violaceum]|uniref:hypothetical protein n=1 Tax=Archangium violaceum TaxID=83451 RepID=UPI00193C02A8|nr:hypothetical protein [Archangium violaceum]QRK11063.1 hypothetical protein JQX13_13910 [Archangium violaceum]
MTQPAFPRRGVLAPLAVVLVLGIGVPAAAEVTVSVREPLLLQVGERSLEIRVEPESISGAGLQLRRVENGLSGTLRGQPVELKWSEDGDITGRAAGESVDLTAVALTPRPGLRVLGWFGGDTAELTLTPTGILGSVGGCSYRLPMAGNRYSGWRTCDVTRGPPTPVTLRIPEELMQLGAAEEGALLALLLSDEALSPAPPTGETPGMGGAGTPSP